MQANRLLGLILDLGLNYKEVDIAAQVGLPASVRAKQDHLGIRSSRSKATPRLSDQILVNHLHEPNRSRHLRLSAL